MNIFKLEHINPLARPLVRFAPPRTKAIVVEVDEADGRVEFADNCATLVKNGMQGGKMIRTTVLGHQIGSAEEQRGKTYHLWFIF